MEDYIKYQQYISSIDYLNSAFQACEIQLLKMPGIYEVIRQDNTLKIGYNIYEMSLSNLHDLMAGLGLKPYQVNIKKGAVVKWLDKLTRANKKSFHGKRLDCCDLNN